MAQAIWALSEGLMRIVSDPNALIPGDVRALTVWTDCKPVAESWNNNSTLWADADDYTIARHGRSNPCPELWENLARTIDCLPFSVTIAWAQTVAKGKRPNGSKYEIPLNTSTALKMQTVKAIARKRDELLREAGEAREVPATIDCAARKARRFGTR